MAYISLASVKNCLPTSYDGSADQYLQTLIVSCSMFLDKFCNRYPGSFLTTNMDELYHGTGVQQLFLNNCPIQSVSRLATTKLPAISVHNIDSDMGTRATVQVMPTGIQLIYIKNAVTITDTFNFVDYPTMTLMANALNSAGNLWTAQTMGGFGSWKSSDLYVQNSLQGAYGARITTAYLWIWWQEYQWFTINNVTGELYSPMNFNRGVWNYRITYTCGYTQFPDDLRQALAELVCAVYLNQETNPNMHHEEMDGYGYTRIKEIGWKGLSEASRLVIGQYKLHRAPKFSTW